MASLDFPPSAEAAANQRPVSYEFGPQSTPYKTDNGLTYTYDPDKNSWVLKKGLVVTQDELTVKLKEKLDKAGGYIMGSTAELSFQETPYSSATKRILLKVDGRIFLNGQNKKLVFNDTTLGPTSIYVDGENNANKYIDISTAGVVLHKKLSFSSTSEDTLIGHNHSSGDVTLLDLASSTSFSGSNDIKISSGGKISIKDVNKEFLSIDTNNSSRVTIQPTANDQKTLLIKQDIHETEILRVDTDTHKIFASNEYNEGLKSGANGAEVKGADGLVTYTEENLVATLGFVKEGFFKPGMNLCATSEEAAEVGGMWTDGFNYYIKVED